MTCKSVRFESLEPRTLCAGIAVNLSQAAQTIQGLGGNYARAKYGDFFIESNDKVGQYTLNNLQPKHARVPIPLRGWEPVNDDADPSSMNMAGFATANTTIIGVFKLMQDLTSRGIPFTATVWDAPNWMVSNPTDKNVRLIPAANYPELIESITSFLKRASEVYGVRPDYISFNEAESGYNLKLKAVEQVAFIKLAGPKFAELGLSYTPKFLVLDAGNAQKLLLNAPTILNDPIAARYTGPISFHGWDSLTYPDSTLTAIAALGQQYNRPIWCEELGYDASANNRTPLPFPTWDYAIKTAQVYYKVLKLAGGSVADYWQMENDFPLLSTGSSGTTLYPSYYVVDTLHKNFTPGSQMVAATSDMPSVLSMAATNGATGKMVVQAINTDTAGQMVTLSGLPAGTTLTVTRSSATENAVNVGSYYSVDGTLTVYLPESSISTLSGVRAQSTRPPSPPPSGLFPPPPVDPETGDPLPSITPPLSAPILPLRGASRPPIRMPFVP